MLSGIQACATGFAAISIWSRAQYTQIRNINMYKLIEIRHNILILWHGNYIMIKRFNFMLEINILRISSQKT